MAARVTCGDLGAASTPFGQEVDHLSLQKGRIGIEHDQVPGPAVESGPLDRDVDLAPDGFVGQGAAEPVQVTAGHRELVALHRIVRQADDPLDVAVALGDPARDIGQRRRPDRRRQHDHQNSIAPRRHFGFDQRRDRDVDVAGRKMAGDGPLRHVDFARRVDADLHAEQETTVDPHLLDVAHVNVTGLERGEQALGQARSILTAQGHQIGQARVHGGLTVSGPTGPPTPTGRRRASRRPSPVRPPSAG